MRVFSLLLLLGISAGAFAQFTLTSVTGSFTDVSANPYSVGSDVDGYGLLASSGATASFSLANRPNTNDYGAFARSAVAFRAQNFNLDDINDVLDVQLPSDLLGATSTASDGETRLFGVTSSNYAGTANSYVLNGSITATGASGAEVLMESASFAFGSPYNATLASGTFSATSLDNGAWDLNPAVGFVTINKDATPTISLNYNIPNYAVQRQMISLVGDSFANPFYDRYYSDMLYFMVGSTTSASYGAGRSATYHEFAPGDMSSAVINGDSGVLNIDISTLSTGSYRWFGSDLVWDWMGDSSGFPSTGAYPATGGWQNYQELSVEVVPEPGSMIAIAVGIGGLFAKRSRKR